MTCYIKRIIVILTLVMYILLVLQITKCILGTFGEIITDVGKWRGNDNINKTPADIDVVGINKSKRIAIIGECKYKNEKMPASDIAICLDRARLIPYKCQKYIMFSKSGYTNEARKEYSEREDILLLTVNELY